MLSWKEYPRTIGGLTKQLAWFKDFRRPSDMFQVSKNRGQGTIPPVSLFGSEYEKTGKMLFNVWVRTNNNYMGQVPDQYPVSPGMTATVDLVTGKRTILSFLTDKLRRTALGAFDER